ncbi:MAG: type VI secretion system protein TssR domain-containing protein, partial [Flavobacteriales bacterium]
MKFQSSKFYLIAVILLSLGSNICAQTKILGKPESFQTPLDYFVVDDDNASVVQELYHNTRSKLKDQPWIVYSDRNSNPVFETSKGLNKIGEIQFGQEPYFVGDEKEDWVLLLTGTYIGKLKLKDPKEIGWVEKSKILLWNSTLHDKATLIHKKVYLLNRADNLEAVINKKKNLKELIVNFYEDPYAQKIRSERTIYDRYFILKKENDMFLLCEDNTLSELYFKKNLLGWVDKRELEEWNTRVCLEPNFTEAAYNERKENQELRCRAYATPFDVEKLIKTKSANALWDNDPILFDASEMSRTNPMRSPGNTLRFPLFKTQEVDGNRMFKSGTVGRVMLVNNSNGKLMVVPDKSIPENDFGQIERGASDHRNRMENVNIFFTIEGTESTYGAKAQIKETIASLENNPELLKIKNKKFGVLIYRDASEKDKLISFLPLTTDINEV